MSLTFERIGSVGLSSAGLETLCESRDLQVRGTGLLLGVVSLRLRFGSGGDAFCSYPQEVYPPGN